MNNKKLIIVLIIFFVVGYATGLLLREVREQTLQQGIELGQEQTVKYIHGFERMPYYNMTNDLNDVRLDTFCKVYLNQTGG